MAIAPAPVQQMADTTAPGTVFCACMQHMNPRKEGYVLSEHKDVCQAGSRLDVTCKAHGGRVLEGSSTACMHTPAGSGS